MLEKEFVPYEQALALKELGFDEPCFTFYPKEGKMGFDGKYHSIKEGYRNSTVNDIWIKRYKKDFECVAAPTFSQAFKWFREKHNLKDKYGVFPHHTIMFNYIIGGGKEKEAELACLIKLIEIVKNK